MNKAKDVAGRIVALFLTNALGVVTGAAIIAPDLEVWKSACIAGGYGVASGGTSSSITVSGDSYTLLTFTSDGTLTVATAGWFDVLLVGTCRVVGDNAAKVVLIPHTY